jgi:phage-related minor tail protein
VTHPPVRRFWLAGLLAGSATLACAQTGGIYTCIDANGRKITSDRPIVECLDRPQDLRNSDGSVRARVPPSLTAEERAVAEDRQRRQRAIDAARKDAVRHDRNLLNRYPDEAAHQRAREAALEPLNQALKSADHRLVELQRERKLLEAEAEFYSGRELPRKLKSRFDDNQTSIVAQQGATANHLAESDRINARYDEELARLRRLWGGAMPGSIGPVPGTATVTR